MTDEPDRSTDVLEQHSAYWSSLSPEQREAEHYRMACVAARGRDEPVPDREAHRVAWHLGGQHV